MRLGRVMLLLAFAVLVLASRPARAQCNTDYRTTQFSETLFKENDCVRFTVAHLHVNLLLLSVVNCYGFLDITRDRIVYHSIDVPGHSMSFTRAEISETKDWDNFAHFVIKGKNYNWLHVEPRVVDNRIQVNAVDNKGLTYKASELLSFVTDFDSALNRLKAELKAKEPPPPAPPPEPPKPKIARLTVNSQPGNVEVYLDGRYQGRTSERGELVVEAPPGDHELRLSLPNYKEWSQVVAFQAEYQSRRDITLESAGPKPLSEKDVEDALLNGLAKVRIITLVEKYGVSFSLNAEIEGSLRAKGADSELLLSIAKNKK